MLHQPTPRLPCLEVRKRLRLSMRASTRFRELSLLCTYLRAGCVIHRAGDARRARARAPTLYLPLSPTLFISHSLSPTLSHSLSLPPPPPPPPPPLPPPTLSFRLPRPTPPSSLSFSLLLSHSLLLCVRVLVCQSFLVSQPLFWSRASTRKLTVMITGAGHYKTFLCLICHSGTPLPASTRSSSEPILLLKGTVVSYAARSFLMLIKIFVVIIMSSFDAPAR